MSDPLASFLATVELLLFFTFDFVIARLLHALKQEHAELEECAPEDSPDLDPVVVLDSLRQTVAEIYDHEKQRLGGVTTTQNISEYGDYDEISNSHNHNNSKYNDMDPNSTVDVGISSSSRFLRGRENALHTTVVVCGFLAPIITFLQLVFPSHFGWCRFNMPVFVQFTGAVPGLAGVVLFATRTMHLASLTTVGRQQWISLMWFRLDFMCLMAFVAFLGLGAWLVTLCLAALALYLAHRVMRIERRLRRLTRETQLVRGEADVRRVFVPGSAEAARALASSDVQGYNALA